MKNHHALYLFLFLLAYQISDFASGNGVNDDIINREKRHLYCVLGLTDEIEKTILAALSDVRKQDPVSLGDACQGKLQDGQLRGVSTLKNITALKFVCNTDDLTFTTHVRMKDAEVWYKWVRYIVFKYTGSVWVKAKEVDFHLEVHFNTSNGLNCEVKNSLITKLNEFEVEFNGLGPLNPILRVYLMRVWRRKGAQKIGWLIKKSLEKKLEKFFDKIN